MSSVRVVRTPHNSLLPSLPYSPKLKKSISKGSKAKSTSGAGNASHFKEAHLASLKSNQKRVQNPEKVLHSTPFLLYIFKKKANKATVIEPSLIMLYWEEKTKSSSTAASSSSLSASKQQRQGARGTNAREFSSASSSPVQHDPSHVEEQGGSQGDGSNSPLPEDFEDRWQISSSKIPVSFEADTEQIAFAVAFVTKRGVEFIEDLNCMINLDQLNVDEQAQLSNYNFNQPCPDMNANTSASTCNKNRIVLHLERKGTVFLEIATINIHLTPSQIHKIASQA